ncbi:MAG: TonB-dependent receptor [Chloracidobacterium sp.]|nr:TonB-dependent receptor [Chloracidobacterium sp.]
MKVFRLIVLFLLLVGAICAQTSIVSGVLMVDGESVANRTIKLVSTTELFETKTDAYGRYSFGSIADGRYLLVYNNKQASVNVAGGQVSIANLTEVVQIAAGTTQTIEQVSKTIDVIDAQQMRDRADFSLTESLRTIPGFRVQQFGGFGRVATIKTRGLRNQDTAILIDGVRFRDPTAITGDASAFLSDLTLTSVDKIEVLRGSGSSLYGTNAIGGTVDFRTPSARRGTHGQIGGAFGGLGFRRFRGNISHGTKNDKFGITAGISRTGYTKGIDGDDNANNTNFQTRVDANPFSKTSISGRIFVSDADVRLNSDPDTAGTLPASNTTIIKNAIPNVSFVPDINDPDKLQHSNFFSGQFVVNQIVNSQLLISGYYQGLKTKRTNDNGPLGIGFQSASTSIYDGTIQTGNVHLNWTPNRINNIVIGYEFESERFGNDGRTPSGTGNFFTRAGQKSNTFYVQDLISLLDGNLQFAGGARVQRYSLDRPEFSLLNAPYSNLTLKDPPTAYTFDGAASYFIQRSGTKLRTHVGNGYRVPSLYERFGSFYTTFGTPSFIAIGDPFLKPEKTIAFDAGAEQNLANDRVRLSATYFWTRLNDIINYADIAPDIGSTPRPFGGYENQRGGNSKGGEFSIKAKATNSTDIFASYTFTDSVQRIPQASGTGIPKTLGVPDDQFTLVATQRFKRFWVNFDFLATSVYLAPIFDTNSFTFQTYIYRFEGNRKGDLTAGYTFGFKKEKMTLRLFGTIENIFDQEYYENGFRTAGATGRVGLSFGF